MLAVLFLFLTGQPSHRCLQWWWSVWWGKRGALRASTCEVKPQSFVCHSPFTASFPSSTSFPRLSCVTPSYPEERPPGCQEEKGQANFAAMGYIRFQNKSATNVTILYGVNGALDKGWGCHLKSNTHSSLISKRGTLVKMTVTIRLSRWKISPYFLFGSGGVAASFRIAVCLVVLMRAGWQAGASLAVGHVHAGDSAGMVGDVTACRCDQSYSAGRLAATPAVPCDSATVHFERTPPSLGCTAHTAPMI